MLDIAIPESANHLRELRQNATLEKLARDWNIHPRSIAERDQLLEMGAYLRAAKANDAIKTAAETGDPFLAGVLDNLKMAYRQEGVETGLTSQEQLFKEAAHRLVAEDANIATAALEWAEYLAKLENQPAS